jgi:CelD/BcsL family acetyltransferase involved in cellulose biosynthesis
VKVHQRWETEAFDLKPVAPFAGPFVGREFLRTWWEHRGSGDLQLVEGDGGLVPLYLSEGSVRFVGETNLTDYHSPLGEGTAALVTEYVATLEDGVGIEFDSLSAEAADVVAAGLAGAGVQAKAVQHEIAAVLRLPDTYEDWLAGLDRRHRHEVRRKERRFEAAAGRVLLTRPSGTDAVARFAALHRMAGGTKGSFMTDDMEAFFAALHRDAGAVIDVLPGRDDAPVAAAFGFEDDEAYYLYNTAYDPAASEISAGIVLLTTLIRRAIKAGKGTFDFLKGDEAYKSRHGALPRPLYELRTTIGSVP